MLVELFWRRAILILAAASLPGFACAQAEAPAAPLTAAATAAAPDPAPIESDDALFPRYTILKPNVAFWTKVFSEYSENQSVVHGQDYPDRIIEVLDFRDRAAYLSANELARLRKIEETEAKARVVKLLTAVDAARHDPDSLRGDQRRVYELFKGIDDPDRFARAAEGVRTQRGLRERTRLALEISGKYLPSMEGVFRGYELPIRLTRLPLVESSFNVDAYSKVGAAGLWQFIPSSARIYMRLNEVVDDRRDPWTSTDGAARHLRDDYAALGAWPLALTAYNHGRGGVARGLAETGGTTLPDLIRGYKSRRFGFASRNFYAEFLAAYDVEREWKKHFGEIERKTPLEFQVVETQHYVPYETLRRMSNADDDLFARLNPAYRPEVIDGKLYVPPGHLIRVPAGSAQGFQVAYATLGANERFNQQRVNHLLYRVKKGDSLSRIAARHGVSMAAIRSTNGLNKKGVLRAGQVLKIIPHRESRPGPISVALGESKPGLTRDQTRAAAATRVSQKPTAAKFRTHKVKPGQTLSSIARSYQVSIKSLRAANGMGQSSTIRAGQKLKVPGSG